MVAERPRSVILRGHSPEFGEVCIKYDTTAAGRARIEAEFDALRTCRRALGEAGPFGCPEPRAMVQDAQGGAALVTSWIACPRADDVLARSLPLLFSRDRVLRRAAAWLARFHAIGDGSGPPQHQPLRAVLDRASLEAHLRAALSPLGEDGAGRALLALAERFEQAAGRSVRITTLHDDFLPQNLFLCGEKTVGIDFTMKVVGPALRDVGTFLANVLWRGYSTLDPQRSARFERDVEAFLDAYYEGLAVGEREVAHLFVLAELARKAQALSAKISNRRFGTSDRAHRLMITGAIRRLLRSERSAGPDRTPAGRA